ncbi:hypothetical protein BMS3Bbin15_01268 [archaeon BMS3Bbin15]|nr:hypothetical protein BMS3Bbin15_01268 [archaeon BMS3Bbin15]
MILDRHVNAAINILHRGMIKVGLGYTDLMPVRGLAQVPPMTQEAHEFRDCPVIKNTTRNKLNLAFIV